jgi:predicted CXXCH cytochrome family protein
MSCHDGTIDMGDLAHKATNAFQKDTDTTFKENGLGYASGMISGTAKLGTDLRNTHPVNFPVSSNSQTDLFILTPATATSMGGGAGTVNTTFPLFAEGAMTNFLECGSCHAVHDSENRPFLRYTMNGSALCLGCHNK